MKHIFRRDINQNRFKYGDYVLLKNDRYNTLFVIYSVHGEDYVLIMVRTGIILPNLFNDKQLIPTKVEGESNVQGGG